MSFDKLLPNYEPERRRPTFNEPSLPSFSAELIEIHGTHFMLAEPPEVDLNYKTIIQETHNPKYSSLDKHLRSRLTILLHEYAENDQLAGDAILDFKRGACAAFYLIQLSGHIRNRRVENCYPKRYSYQTMMSGMLCQVIGNDNTTKYRPFTEVSMEKLARSGIGAPAMRWLEHINYAARTGACSIFIPYAFEGEGSR